MRLYMSPSHKSTSTCPHKEISLPLFLSLATPPRPLVSSQASNTIARNQKLAKPSSSHDMLGETQREDDQKRKNHVGSANLKSQHKDSKAIIESEPPLANHKSSFWGHFMRIVAPMILFRTSNQTYSRVQLCIICYSLGLATLMKCGFSYVIFCSTSCRRVN